MDARKASGVEIYEKGGQIEKIDEVHYAVRSQSTDAKYDVSAARSN